MTVQFGSIPLARLHEAIDNPQFRFRRYDGQQYRTVTLLSSGPRRDVAPPYDDQFCRVFEECIRSGSIHSPEFDPSRPLHSALSVGFNIDGENTETHGPVFVQQGQDGQLKCLDISEIQ